LYIKSRLEKRLQPKLAALPDYSPTTIRASVAASSLR
jgi:hypothetical protein